ncbi:MAG: hypothetical protein ACRD0K_23610 [Egibacteraceae bacterium]
MTLPAEVRVTDEVSREALDHLLEGLRSFGLNPSRGTVARRRGISDVPWLVWVALSLQPFLNTLVQRGADDVYTKLKELVSNALSRRHEQSATVMVLQDTVTGLELLLESDLPAGAYRQLSRLDLSAIPKGRVHYDRERREWICERDERDQQNRSQG